MKKNTFGMTLIELVMALVLTTFVVLGFTSFSLFSRTQVLSSDRRIKVSNDVPYVLQHMQKYISRGIGSIRESGVDVVGGPSRVRIKWYKNGLSGPLADQYLAYYYSPPGGTYDVKFFSSYPASGWNSSGGEVLSSNITGLWFSWGAGNYLQTFITGCYDTSQISTCGSEGNPSVAMSVRIRMPAVSTH